MKREMPWPAEGLITGFIGYLTVAIFFAAMNLFAGEGLFHTPALLGSALFSTGGEEGTLLRGPAPIIAYNGIHLLVSLLIGLAAAWLVFQTERNRPLWFAIFFVFLAGFIYSVAFMGIFAAELAYLLSWPVIVVANLMAGITAGGYLWWRHDRLWAELREASGRE